MPTLYESLNWHHLPLAGTPASPNLQLSYGEVGTGKTALLIAGTHGDEGPWSALAIRTLLERSIDSLHGRLRVVFTANPLAAQANTRNAPIDSPNCVDLDGCFPGVPNGSHSERIAALLAPLIAKSDIVLDLHGGGSWCVNAFTKWFPGSEDLAEAIGAPFCREAPNKPGGLTSYAKTQGAKVINIEVGGRGKNERHWHDRIVEGLERVLHQQGILILDPSPPSGPQSIPVGPTQVLRSRSAGIFIPSVGEDAVGTSVNEGMELGRILDLYTLQEQEVIRAPYSNTALLLLRPHICVVETGALLYALAQPEEDL